MHTREKERAAVIWMWGDEVWDWARVTRMERKGIVSIETSKGISWT